MQIEFWFESSLKVVTWKIEKNKKKDNIKMYLRELGCEGVNLVVLDRYTYNSRLII
jgi:hypothetical protein